MFASARQLRSDQLLLVIFFHGGCHAFEDGGIIVYECSYVFDLVSFA